MGTAYKRWYPYLRSGSSQHLRLPSRGPTLPDADDRSDVTRSYPVFWAPANAWQGHFAGPYAPSDEAVFAPPAGVLRLPKVVIFLNGCWADRSHGPGDDGCGHTYPVFSSAALRHYSDVGGLSGPATFLAEALGGTGIAVYASSGTNQWIESSMPSLADQSTDWIGGDCYYITVQNNSGHKGRFLYSQDFRRVYVDTEHGRDICDYADTDSGIIESAPTFHPELTYVRSPANYPPLDFWARGVARFRNWHGLACACPWEGDSATIVGSLINFPPPDNAYFASRYRLDLDDADNTSSMRANVAELNAASPDVPGDATWEYADVAVDQDYGFFLEKVRSWFGV